MNSLIYQTNYWINVDFISIYDVVMLHSKSAFLGIPSLGITRKR